jgi:hypothetical protein
VYKVESIAHRFDYSTIAQPNICRQTSVTYQQKRDTSGGYDTKFNQQDSKWFGKNTQHIN